MKNLLLKLIEKLTPRFFNYDILIEKKHKLQEELHYASEERDFTRAELIGDELLKVNKALNK